MIESSIMAVLWLGFQGNIGMIGDRLEAGSCQNWDIERLSCHRCRYSMPYFVASALHELSPVMMRVYAVFAAKIACIWHGMLTERNNYRIMNAVIAQFYRLGRIIQIMGRVSECYTLRVEHRGASTLLISVPDEDPGDENHS